MFSNVGIPALTHCSIVLGTPELDHPACFTFVSVYLFGAVRIAQSFVSFNAILVFCLRERDRHVIN